MGHLVGLVYFGLLFCFTTKGKNLCPEGDHLTHEQIASLLKTMTACASCEGRCGEIIHVNQSGIVFNSRYTCSCDDLCMTYGDCCEDIYVCPEQFAKARKMSASYPNTYSSCESLNVDAFNLLAGYISDSLVYSLCPGDQYACIRSATDWISLIPVVDQDAGIFFINAKCALCNGVIKIEMLQSTLVCPKDIHQEMFQSINNHTRMRIQNITNAMKTGNVPTEEDMITLLEEAKCLFKFTPHNNQNIHICLTRLMFHCSNASCANQDIVSRCQDVSQAYVMGSFTYKNIFCVLCFEPTSAMPTCGYLLLDYSHNAYRQLAFPLLMNFRSESGLQFAVSDIPNCPEETIWLP